MSRFIPVYFCLGEVEESEARKYPVEETRGDLVKVQGYWQQARDYYAIELPPELLCVDANL